MGAYLSEPVTDTNPSNEKNDRLSFGASSMQGWRVSQEDAHCCLLDYDKESALFGVFDGHGGAEVAQYSAANLPKLFKSMKAYKEGNFEEALIETFLEFDSSLIETNVIEELKCIAGTSDDAASDDEKEEASLLREEANIPIETLIARYGSSGSPERVPEEKPKTALPGHMTSEMKKEDIKPLSPFLRAKQPPANGVSLNSTKDPDNIEPSCSTSSKSYSNGEIGDTTNVRGDECESVSSSSAGKVDKVMVDNDNSNDVSSTKNEQNQDSTTCDSTPSSTNCTSKKPKEEISSINMDDDGNVSTSSEVENVTNNEDLTSPTSSDSPRISKDAITSSGIGKGKGKQKKTIIPQMIEKKDEDAKPIYEAFLQDFESDESACDDDETDDFKNAPEESESSNDEEEDEDSSDEGSDEENEDDDQNEMLMSSTFDYEKPGKDSGCTAVFAFLSGDNLYVANAGDSRCVVSRSGKAFDMSIDHKPEDDIERDRIKKAGGKITMDGRVNGGLNLSRAIGDHAYKDNPNIGAKEQMITALPDVMKTTISPEDEFMVLACDGIWNSMTSQQVVDFVGKRIKTAAKLSDICEEMFHNCLSPNTHGDGTGCDNMTCIIIKFHCFNNKRKLESNDATVVAPANEATRKRQKTDDGDSE